MNTTCSGERVRGLIAMVGILTLCVAALLMK